MRQNSLLYGLQCKQELKYIYWSLEMYSTGFPLIWCTAFYHGLYISYFPDRYPFLFLPMQDSVSQICLETTALHTPKHNCSFWEWLVTWLTVELVKQRKFIRMKWAVLGIKLVHRNKLWKQVGKHNQSHPLNEMVCDECLALYSKRVQLPRHVERKHTAVTYSFEQGSWQEVLGSFSEKALTQWKYCSAITKTLVCWQHFFSHKCKAQHYMGCCEEN